MVIVHDYDDLGRPIVSSSTLEADVGYRDYSDERLHLRTSSYVDPMMHNYGIGTTVDNKRMKRLINEVSIRDYRDRFFYKVAKKVYRFMHVLGVRPKRIIAEECGLLFRRLRKVIMAYNRRRSVRNRGCNTTSFIAALLLLAATSKLSVPIDEELLEDVSGCSLHNVKKFASIISLNHYSRTSRYSTLVNEVFRILHDLGIENTEVYVKAVQYGRYLLGKGVRTQTSICVGVSEALQHFGILISPSELSRYGCKEGTIMTTVRKYGIKLPKGVSAYLGNRKYFLEVPQYLKDLFK